MYSMTIFKNMYDNQTHRRLDLESWDKFVKFLYKLSERPLKGKKDAELISPAIYQPETTRANKNVLAWAGWCAVDIDDWEFEGDLNAELKRRYSDWNFVVYSTASSTVAKPKFRLVFQLDRHIQTSDIKHFWFALQSYLDDRGDKQCKDLSRMYYIPADYANANNFIFHNSGAPLAVDYLLREYPYTEKKAGNSFLDKLPEEWQRQIIDHQKSALENTNVYWSNYQDCPFISKKILSDWNSIAYTDGSGRYSMIYKIMISIAGNAIKEKYPITANQIVDLIKQIDNDTSRKYQHRALDTEANNALEYAYRNVLM